MSQRGILVVEDEPVQAAVIERLLVSLGYSIAGRATSGAEALRHCEDLRPDLVLMDIGLGGEVDGIEIAARIPRTLDLPVIFLTAHDDDVTLQRAKRVDPAGYLVKPLKKRELRTAIEFGMYRHAMERKLRQAEERYRGLFESANDAIFILDGPVFIDCNGGALTLFGRTREEFLGKTPFDFSPRSQGENGSSQELGAARLNSALQGNTEVFEWTHCRKDGTPFASEVTLTLLSLQDGRYVQAIVRDIEKRKRAEDALQRERILLRTLIDNLPDAIYVKDRDSRKTVSNRADVHNMRMRSEVEVLGKDDFDLFPEDVAAGFFADDQSVFRTGVPVLNKEEYVIDENGEKRHLLTTKLPLRDKQGEITGLVGISHEVTHIKKAEESLKLFRTLIDHSSDAIEVIDPETGRIIDANQKAWMDLGYTRDELLSLSVCDIARQLNPTGFVSTGRELQHSDFLVFDSQHRRKDGSEFPVEINMKYVQLDRGYVVAVARDTTRRKQADDVLRESRRRLSEIIQFFPEATVVIDRDGKVAAWNRAMEELTGVGAREMLGKGDHEYSLPFYGERRPILADVVMRNLKDAETLYPYFRRNGDKISAETYITTRARGEAYVLATATALRDAGGAINGAIESLLDITSRKNAELALRESEERFRLISENVADIIMVIDREGKCLYASPSSRLEGFDPGHIAGKSFVQSVHPDDAASVRGRIEKVFSEQTHQSLGFRLANDGGPWRFKEATLSPLEGDAAPRIVAVIRDVTDRITREAETSSLQAQVRQRNLDLEATLEEMKKMQAGLVQSEKMASIGQLTAGIAHEINNPLAFVSSNLNRFREYFEEIHSILQRWEPLREALSQDERYRARAQEIKAAEEKADLPFVIEDFSRLMGHTTDGTERIRSIVERLRGFTHLADIGFADADINAAIDDTLNLTWNELKYKATITKEYGPLPVVECNIGEIKQVLVNLLVNAAHAIPEKGTITIRTRPHGERVVISIEDTGSGIAPENLKKVFDPFFTTKPVGKGTGLGLWISATIIQKHGGSISARSEPGCGTTMTFELPLHQDAAAEDAHGR